jgi:hypothetical protein
MQLIVETADWDALGGHWVEGGFDRFEISNVITTIDEQVLTTNKGKLIKVVDVLGRTVKTSTRSPLFYIYENGVVEQKLIIE